MATSIDDLKPPTRLTVRASPAGGGLRDRVWPDPPASLSGKKDLVVLIHGFNNPENAADWSFSSFTRNMYNRYQVPYGVIHRRLASFFWPGDGSKNKPFSTALYFKQVDKAVRVGRLLATCLNNHSRDVNGLKVTFIAHSLGCRVALEACKLLSHSNTVTIEGIYLLAAAVPADLCQKEADPETGYPEAVAPVEAVAYSEKDSALKYWFGPGQTIALDGGLLPRAVGRRGEPEQDRWSHRIDTRLDHEEYWTESKSLDELAGIFGRPQPWAITERKPDEYRPREWRFLEYGPAGAFTKYAGI